MKSDKSGNGNGDGPIAQTGLSFGFVESMLSDYLRDPASVPDDWRAYFQTLPKRDRFESLPRLAPSFRPSSVFNPNGLLARAQADRQALELAVHQHRVDQLIRNYRVRGHMIADLDPIHQPRPVPAELDPGYCGLSDDDMDRPFSTDTIAGPDVQTLRQILLRLRNTYCRHIGVQFMHIDDLEVRRWLQDRMESTENRIELARDQQLRILKRLTDAVVFEKFIQTKYIGAKSFSLEGAESLLPLLEMAIEKAGRQNVDEIVIGMAHRGRLNVLANIMGKHPQEIFREFEDVDPHLYSGGGDVKYHLGHSHDWRTPDGRRIHLSLCFNPSHLEHINPVALGRTRAKQDRDGDVERKRGLVLLIHGDAAFAGEGVVAESLNLSQLDGYTVGGALHIVVNNQIGFTTSPQEARSSVYCTDVAKMLQIPIFHVNGEHPEAVAQVIDLAMDFRAEFRRDVVIDMYCYRLRGHNEGDEPSFTQPMLYRAIEQRTSVRAHYVQHLLELGQISKAEADQIAERERQRLEEALAEARSESYARKPNVFSGIWAGYCGGPQHETPDVDTGVQKQRLVKLLRALTRTPDGFHPHSKIKRGLDERRKMADGERPLDWSAAEALALASLATEGLRVRMSGQDSQRGTFSQRHAVLHDVENGRMHMPLAHLAEDQAAVEIYNSPLSEAGVLGYEYGYSLDSPDCLVLWEAQFGDFFNAAQVFVDQFLTSAEDKWRRLSGLVMLLPHGFEGQGPEHSSARLERWLTLAAEDNIQVVFPTTTAQYFHVLRRQMLRSLRKPLIVLTPKSLLRHKQVVSSLEDCARGRFQRVIADPEAGNGDQVERVLLCSGKIYYELLDKRKQLERDDVAIVRIEQLYPMPLEEMKEALSTYHDGTPVTWVQEEPRNMGAWFYLRTNLGHHLFDRFYFNGLFRPESASPATGSSSSHKLEQEQLLTAAFASA